MSYSDRGTQRAHSATEDASCYRSYCWWSAYSPSARALFGPSCVRSTCASSLGPCRRSRTRQHCRHGPRNEPAWRSGVKERREETQRDIFTLPICSFSCLARFYGWMGGRDHTDCGRTSTSWFSASATVRHTEITPYLRCTDCSHWGTSPSRPPPHPLFSPESCDIPDVPDRDDRIGLCINESVRMNSCCSPVTC